ncbi:kinase-like protein [Peniophora sp. CONT]|nr:kinase-like protein [Peniophora sp. CONT]
MLPHAFVVARLLPSPSSSWTSPYGSAVAQSLQTNTFVALQIHLHPETGFNDSSSPFSSKGLFIVSRHKPRAPFQDFYLPLTSDDQKQALKLNSPLSSDDGPLYIHTFPMIYDISADRKHADPSSLLIEPSHHQLDEESYVRLITFFRDTCPPHVPVRLSGGLEPVQAGWETFSGQPKNERQFERPQRGFKFEISPFHEAALATVTTTDAWMELTVLRRLQEEYSWRGVGDTIDWLGDLRYFTGVILPCVTSAHPYNGDVPGLTDESTRALALLSAPVDSIPPPPPEDNDPWDWLPPDPAFAFVPSLTTVEPVDGYIRGVVFDICGAIVDFTSSAREALQHLGVPEVSLDLWMTRLREQQALESRSRGRTHIEIARRALRSVSMSLHDISEPELEAAVQILARPKLIPGIHDSLTALREKGLLVFGYSTLDTMAFQSFVKPLISSLPLTIISDLPDPCNLFSPCTELDMKHILQFVRTHGLSNIATEQIVLLSPSPIRALEPATAAGMATALLVLPDHPEVRSSPRLVTVPSTMVLEPHDLVSIICSPSTSWERSNPREQGFSRAWRVNGMWQSMHTPGPYPEEGATVIKALSWLTNEVVALKYEIPLSPATPSSVWYEARVYKQLEGSNAIPRVRWSGSDGGADVLVMDFLGPTLEELRLVSRGALGLKSVLMIGIQMLDFIEYAHGRGVVLRDIKPQNAAVGYNSELASTIYSFDFGNAKLYVDSEGAHMPLRTDRKISGTVRFCSHWSHQGLESSRRDDIVLLGHMLLYLLHGRLPWQGVFAPSLEAKIQRMGEMKTPKNPAMIELLAHSPAGLSELLEHAHRLEFAQKPDYALLRALLERAMQEYGWVCDGGFDWVRPEFGSWKGTLLPWEYKFVYEEGSVPPSLRPLYDSSGRFCADYH